VRHKTVPELLKESHCNTYKRSVNKIKVHQLTFRDRSGSDSERGDYRRAASRSPRQCGLRGAAQENARPQH
jgi:hypothetical protein